LEKIIRFEPEAKYSQFQKLVLNAFKIYNESRASEDVADYQNRGKSSW